MAEFRQYVPTRFNAGLYKQAARLKTSRQEWMAHRLRLFTALALPSMIGRTCQDFIWLVLMEYPLNNCPSLVEDSQTHQTIIQWDHTRIPPEVDRRYIKDKPYWLQVVHSQNRRNTVDTNNPTRIVHTELPARPEDLGYFSIDASRLPPP